MKNRSYSVLLAALLLSVGAVQAQSGNRSVVQAPPKQAPPLGTPITPVTPSTALPRAEGLPSPSPNPAGLPPLPNTTAPAAPTAAAAPATPVPLTPPLDGTILMPGTAIGSTGTPGTPGYTPGSTAVMGAGGGPNAPQTVPSSGGYTALQLAESFLRADANRDGELSRAEFQRLSIAPAAFEEMDRDRNGIVTRSEYDDGSR
jgi:hypothetical protein